MQNPRRPYLSLISCTTKLTTVAIMLDVLIMLAYAVFLPHSQVREPLILTAVAFALLVVIFFYSLFYDAEVISSHFKRLEIAKAETTVAAAVAETPDSSPVPTVASRVVGIRGVRLLDEELLWTIEAVEPWSSTNEDNMLPPDPVVLRVRK